MSESKPNAMPNPARSSSGTWGKSEQGALELKIAELTGVLEHLTQTSSIAQRHSERLQNEVEDLQRQLASALSEYKAQEELNRQKRQDLHAVNMELKRSESLLIALEERIRVALESVEISEKNSQLAVESMKLETHEKIKAIKHDFDSERESLTIGFEVHSREIDFSMKRLSEDLAQSRKKQQRALDIEIEEARKKAEDSIARLLQEGRNKNEALIRATELTAVEVHRESEVATKRLLLDANQKAAEIIRAAQVEAEEIRRRTHSDEINFLKEKNLGLGELKLMLANAREEAKSILASAQEEAKVLQQKVEADNEARIHAGNQKIHLARKTAEKETQEFIQNARSRLAQEAREQEARLDGLKKASDDELAQERQRSSDEARILLAQARERAQAIIDSANHERTYKLEEIKATEASIFDAARQSAASITRDADKIALTLVEEARNRAKNVERTLDGLINEARDEAAIICGKADAYAEKIRRDLPDPADWERELNKLQQNEQARVQALIEPIVKNYLAAIDMAINEVLMNVPQKYQSHKVIQEFIEAIGLIQRKKKLINIGELLSRAGPQAGSQGPQTPIKGAS